MNECVICLDDCNTDISDYRIEDCECNCKYFIHFECLSKYLESNKNQCLYCGKDIFSTNFKSNEDNNLIHIDIDSQSVTNYHPITDERESNFKFYISIIIVIILLGIILYTFL